jgi:hypothetical protein
VILENLDVHTGWIFVAKMGGELNFLVNRVGTRDTPAYESDDEEPGGQGFIGSIVRLTGETIGREEKKRKDTDRKKP